MKALLLAAGLGTRLRPLTNFLPKCLVPIGNRPLLEYWLANLFDAGFDKILINTHYLSDIVVSYVRGTPWSDRIVLAHEPELLGTAGTIREHRKFFGNETFFVAHADNLSLFDPGDMIRRHALRPSGSVMTMMTFDTSTPESCGIVSLDRNAVVTGFFEKVSRPPGSLANAAVYIAEPNIMDLIGKLTSTHPDFSTEVIPALLGKIFTHHNNRFHLDIGTLNAWSEAQTSYPLLRKQAPSSNDGWSRILDDDGQRLRRALDQFRYSANISANF
jgi:mannose-1-phosphate guanylyltransferase